MQTQSVCCGMCYCISVCEYITHKIPYGKRYFTTCAIDWVIELTFSFI